MSNRELHPFVSALADRYMQIDAENQKGGGPRITLEELPLKEVGLENAGVTDVTVRDYAEEVSERYNYLLARWTGNIAVASVANIVTNFRELTLLPHPDKKGRTALVVQAERYRAGFGFIFEVDGGSRPSRGILKINATLPVHEPGLSMLSQSAKQSHRDRLRTERYKRLHQVDQVTVILGKALGL